VTKLKSSLSDRNGHKNDDLSTTRELGDRVTDSQYHGQAGERATEPTDRRRPTDADRPATDAYKDVRANG
jgi:hypothetical protein